MDVVIQHLKCEVGEMKQRFFSTVKEAVKVAVQNLKFNKDEKEETIKEQKSSKRYLSKKTSQPKGTENGSKIRCSPRILDRKKRKRKTDEYLENREEEENIATENEFYDKKEGNCGKNDTLKRYYSIFKSSKKCDKCFEVFSDIRTFQTHICAPDTYSMNTTFDCPLCDKKYNSPNALFSHQNYHSYTNDLKCPTCNITFDTLYFLTVHHHRKHRNVPEKVLELLKRVVAVRRKKSNIRRQVSYKCEHCPQRFHNIRVYNNHILSHEKNEDLNNSFKFSCPICREIFSSVYNLFQHQSFHSSKDCLKCQCCNKSFEDLDVLTIHFHKEHCDVPEIFLDALEKAIRRRNKFKIKHTTTNYKCTYCRQEFKDVRLFNNHIISHNQESKKDSLEFFCPLCEKKFRSTTSLFIHKNWHASSNNFQCSLCNHNVDSFDTLALHHHKEHRERNEKLILLLESAVERRRKDNISRRRVNYNCEHCPQQFSNVRLFNDHVLNHLQEFAQAPPLSFSCPVCEKEYKALWGMILHLNYHESTKNETKCKKCGEKFENIYSLTLHHYKEHFKVVEPVHKFIQTILHSSIKENLRRQRSKIYHCDISDETFNHKTVFNSHIRIHNFSTDLQEKQMNNSNLRLDVHSVDDSKESEGDFANTFNCTICQEEFETEHGLKMHFIHHSSSELSAAQEKETFDKQKGIAKKLAKCKNIYKCNVCSETFFRIFKYRQHIIEIHKGNKELRKEFCFNCSLCDESFNFKSKLNVHLRDLHGIFLQCPICNENCSTKEIFVQHMREIHSDGSNERFVKCQDGFLCKMCGVTVRSYGKIIHHFLTHHSQKKITCEICGNCFAFEKDKKRHQTLVHLDKTFCCEECGKQFKTKRQMKGHKLTHVDKDKKKRIQCKECDKTFASDPVMRCHYTACHTDEKHFKCNICNKAFASAPTLHIHKITVCEKEKAKEATCPICEMTFPNYILLCYHKANVHKYGNSENNLCHLCNKTFDSSSCLYSHNKCYHTPTSGEKGVDEKINCSICGTSRPNKNSLFEHMLTHGEEKPFECQLCGEKFKQKCGFYQHRKIRHKNEKDNAKLKIDLEMIKKLKKNYKIDDTISISPESKVISAEEKVEVNLTDITASNEPIAFESNVPQDREEIFAEAEVLFDLQDVLIAIVAHQEEVGQLEESSLSEMCKDSKSSYADFLKDVSAGTSSCQTLPNINESNKKQLTRIDTNNKIATVIECSTLQDGNCKINDKVTESADLRPQVSSLEYDYDHEDCDCSVEDVKPLFYQSNQFPQDPFPIQLKVTLRKLKEYNCSDCDKIYFTRHHLNNHVNSSSHKLATETDLSQNILSRKKTGGTKTKRKLTEDDPQSKKRGEVKRKKLYPCPYCDERFSSTRKHNDHVILHKNPKVCLLCEEVFPYAPGLVNHYNLKHNGENIWKCTLCLKGFLSNEYLERHLKSHQKSTDVSPLSKTEESNKKPRNCNKRENSYTCDRCGEKLPGIKLYKEHLLQHNDDKFKCAYCPVELVTIGDLNSHYSINHENKMPHQCEECHEGFSLRLLLEQHQKLNHSSAKTNGGVTIQRDPVDGKFVCEHCGKRFAERRYFKYHLLNIHDGREKKHSCDFCTKQFRTRTNLKLHRRTHTGERPYSCDQCDVPKTFISRSTLKKHVDSVHLGKFVVCEYCGVSFSGQDRLNVHRRSHTGERPFSCNQCHEENVSFVSATSLKKHIDTVHLQIRMPCEVCGKLLRGSHNLKIHMRIHTGERPYSCTFCPKTFYASTDLKKHSDAVHLRVYKGKRTPFQCPVCSESFRSQTALDKHSVLHDPNRPFACDLCTCRFNFNSNLVFHKKNVHEKQGIVYCKKGKKKAEELQGQDI